MRRLFLLVAAMVRALPRVRGKVRLGQLFYRLANRAGLPFSVSTTLFHEHLRFRLNLTSAHERMAFLMEEYEAPTIALLDSLFSRGTILDIGANIGLIAIPLAARTRDRAGRRPHVIAFEALPSNCSALETNIRSNGLEHIIRVLPIALGSESKQAMIQIEGDDPTRTGTANILPSDFSFRQIPIEVRRLDDLFRAGEIPEDVTLIKIDTDGYDLEILRGGRRLFMERRPICHVELNLHCLGWHQQTLDDVLQFLSETDYELLSQTSYGSRRFTRYERGRPFFENAVLVPSEKLAGSLIDGLLAESFDHSSGSGPSPQPPGPQPTG